MQEAVSTTRATSHQAQLLLDKVALPLHNYTMSFNMHLLQPCYDSVSSHSTDLVVLVCLAVAFACASSAS
jgi:hypothetical protein